MDIKMTRKKSKTLDAKIDKSLIWGEKINPKYVRNSPLVACMREGCKNEKESTPED